MTVARDMSGPRYELISMLAQAAMPTPETAASTDSLLRTTLRYRRPGAERLLVPGGPATSVLVRRLSSTDAVSRMPPLGTTVPDPLGIALIQRWIREMPPAADVAPPATSTATGEAR